MQQKTEERSQGKKPAEEERSPREERSQQRKGDSRRKKAAAEYSHPLQNAKNPGNAGYFS